MSNSQQQSVPKKVILFTTTLAKGGTERNLAVYAKQLALRGINVEVWYLYHRANDYSQTLAASGVQLKCFAVKSRLGVLSSLRRVGKCLAQSDADLIHLFLPTVLYSYLFSRVFFGLRTPTLYSCGAIKFLAPLERPMTRQLAKSCYPFIGNSQAVSDALESVGVPPELIRVIPNGHDLSAYESPFDPNEFRTKHALPLNHRIITTVGRLIPGKRHVDLLGAFHNLAQTYPDITLLIVGDGECNDDLRALVSKLDLDERVHFFGVREDVPDCLRASDFFVFPSESEGLPNSLIEACLARLPIVATDIQPNLGVVEDGQSALLVPIRSPERIEEKLKLLLDDPDLSKKLKNTGRLQAVKRFSVEQAITMLLKAYSDCLEHHSKRNRS